MLQILALNSNSSEPQKDRNIPSVPEAPKCEDNWRTRFRLSDKGRISHLVTVAKYRKK